MIQYSSNKSDNTVALEEPTTIKNFYKLVADAVTAGEYPEKKSSFCYTSSTLGVLVKGIMSEEGFPLPDGIEEELDVDDFLLGPIGEAAFLKSTEQFMIENKLNLLVNINKHYGDQVRPVMLEIEPRLKQQNNSMAALLIILDALVTNNIPDEAITNIVIITLNDDPRIGGMGVSSIEPTAKLVAASLFDMLIS